jgi:hypothetical protein
MLPREPLSEINAGEVILKAALSVVRIHNFLERYVA